MITCSVLELRTFCQFYITYGIIGEIFDDFYFFCIAANADNAGKVSQNP